MPSRPKKYVAIALEIQHSLPWYQNSYQGILQYAQGQGWDCVLDPFLAGHGDERGPAIYDGVVGRVDQSLLSIIESYALPVVSLPSLEKHAQVPQVDIDRRAGMQQLVEHLTQCGYHRFANLYIDGNHSSVVRRLFADAVVQAGFTEPLSLGHDFVFHADREAILEARSAIRQWLDRVKKPVAVLANYFIMARFLADTCRQMGLRVPQDVGIATFVDDKMITTSAPPTLTALDYDYVAVGYESAAMLDKLMHGLAADPLHKLVPPRRVIVRDSTDVFAFEDAHVTEAMRYIAEHIRRNITADEIATHLGVSESTLRRRIEQATGRTISCEIRRMRVDYIQRLLAESDKSISDVSRHCGFGNTSHFARYFKREAGCSPSTYRRRYRAEGGDG